MSAGGLGNAHSKELEVPRLLITVEATDDEGRADLQALLADFDSIDAVEEVGFDSESARLEPVTMTIVAIGIIVGTGIVTRVVDWWRARSDCLLVIDARGEDVKVEARCDLAGYRGKTIIVTDDRTQVTIERERGAFSMDEVLNALKAGASASELPKMLPQGADNMVIEPRQSLDGT